MQVIRDPSQPAHAEVRWRQSDTRLFEPRPVVLAVASAGALVPRAPAAYRVHSTFAGACNFLCIDTLLTLAGPQVGGGPASLVLRHAPPRDLRQLFAVGEMLHWQGGVLRSRRAVLRLEQATLWQPLARRSMLPSMQVDANLALAARRLAARRTACSSVVERSAADLVPELVRATREYDCREALRVAQCFVGWGEGLTPAGDDFLVGWLAALERLENDAPRQTFFDTVAAALVLLAPRTTPIAAHFLRLAAQRHYVEVLDTLLDALLCEHRLEPMQHALENALAVGATSGADLVSGVLAGITAWRSAMSTS
jgi:hypothetical protein